MDVKILVKEGQGNTLKTCARLNRMRVRTMPQIKRTRRKFSAQPGGQDNRFHLPNKQKNVLLSYRWGFTDITMLWVYNRPFAVNGHMIEKNSPLEGKVM